LDIIVTAHEGFFLGVIAGNLRTGSHKAPAGFMLALEGKFIGRDRLFLFVVKRLVVETDDVAVTGLQFHIT